METDGRPARQQRQQRQRRVLGGAKGYSVIQSGLRVSMKRNNMRTCTVKVRVIDTTPFHIRQNKTKKSYISDQRELLVTSQT